MFFFIPSLKAWGANHLDFIYNDAWGPYQNANLLMTPRKLIGSALNLHTKVLRRKLAAKKQFFSG